MGQNQHGFTVLEVVITVGIAGFILLGMTVMLNSLNTVNDRARDLTLVNALAENKIESLRSVGFIGLSDGTTDFTDELPDAIAPPRQAEIIISSPAVNIKQVDIEISYNDQGTQRDAEYRTYIGELGIGQY